MKQKIARGYLKGHGPEVDPSYLLKTVMRSNYWRRGSTLSKRRIMS